jgi:hypothetical protein
MTDIERNNYYNNDNSVDVFNQEDMINYKGGGYSLPSAFALVQKKDMTTKDTTTKDNKNTKNNKVSEEYDHLVIPASLYYMERQCLGEPMMMQDYYMKNDNKENDDEEDAIISEDMYDKLLLLAEDKSRKQKKYTKNNKKNLYKKSVHKKTRRVK